MAVRFENHSIQVKEALNSVAKKWLYLAAGEVEAQAKRNTRVDTGQLKNSWTFKVNEGAMEAVVGSPLENAIWEEFGTGQYALHGDGRKTAWTYKTADGKYYTTTGKKPSRAFAHAFSVSRVKLQNLLEAMLRGMV